jgi:hypothetical protein
LKLLLLYKIYNVFHISLLEPWYFKASIVIELDLVKIKGKEEFKVELVLAYREGRKGREYLVY